LAPGGRRQALGQETKAACWDGNVLVKWQRIDNGNAQLAAATPREGLI
jgi:hypothetical protein